MLVYVIALLRETKVMEEPQMHNTIFTVTEDIYEFAQFGTYFSSDVPRPLQRKSRFK